MSHFFLADQAQPPTKEKPSKNGTNVRIIETETKEGNRIAEKQADKTNLLTFRVFTVDELTLLTVEAKRWCDGGCSFSTCPRSRQGISLFLFLESSPRICFIDLRERERNVDVIEKYRLAPTHAPIGD